MKIEQITLKNKLKTLFINTPGANSCTIQIWFRAGSSLENLANEGIAHFLEHMFFKGTKKRPGSAIAKEVESFGGEVNAFTSFDYTCYYINAPMTKISETVDILMDMVSNPLFTESELYPEREVVFEEYRRSLDNPSQFSFKELQKSCFMGGYEHPILGNQKTIKNFSRKQLVEFRNKFYNLSNALLVVAGNIDKDKTKNNLKKIIEKYKIPSGKASVFKEFKLKNKKTINVHNKEVRQAVLTIAISAPAYEDHHSVFEDMAINCLAHGESSRLYSNLVHDSSICSTVSGSTMFFSKGGSHFIRFVCPEKNLEKSLEKFVELLQGIFKHGFDSNELSKIKNQYLASKIYEKESIEAFAFSKGYGFAQTGDITCEEKFIERIKECKLFEVNDALKNIFKRPLHLCLQLPKSEDKKVYNPILEKLSVDIKNLYKNQNKNEHNIIEKSKFDSLVKVIQLKEGIKLIHRQNIMTPTFVLHAYLKGGISYETEQNNGLFHLLSKVITMGFNGCDFNEMKLDLDDKSASLNGFAGKNAFGLTMHGQSAHNEDLFKYFFKTLITPEFPQKYIDHEREIIYRILENQKEDPAKQCFKMFNKTIFTDHPYSYEHLGPKENIDKFKREDLIDLHKKFLTDQELTITYCGDQPIDVVELLLRPYIDLLESRTKKTKNQSPNLDIDTLEQHLTFDREQTQILLGTTGFQMGSTEDLMLKMLTTHLSGQGSDLFVEVRDKQGLCYSVQPIQMSALNGGYWGIFMASGHDKTAKGIEALFKILDKIRNHGLSQKELDTIKNIIDGQNQINIQTNEDWANVYSVAVLHELGIDFSKRNQEKAKKIKLKEMNAFLKEFLSRKFLQVTVGKDW